jgi:phage terminase large subunit-like protein
VGRIEAMPRDPGDGGNAYKVSIDEFHEANDTTVIETGRSGMGQRRETSTSIITSPGHNKAGPCYAQFRDIAVKTLEGVIENDRFLAVPFELDDESEWDDVSMIEKSNPMTPYIPSLRPFVQERIQEAKKFGGSVATNIKIKNCGIWVDQASVWLPSDVVDKNNHGTKLEDLVGKRCYPGFDLSSTTDLTARADFFPDPFGKDYDVLVLYYYLSRARVEAERKDGVVYKKWEDEGFIRVHEGDTINLYQAGLDALEDWKEGEYQIDRISYDPRAFKSGIAPALDGTQYLALCESVNQGYGGLAEPVRYMESRMIDGKMDILYNPVLKWNIQCTEMKQGTQGDYIPDKSQTMPGGPRIDGVSASLTGVAGYLDDNAQATQQFFAEVW